MDRVDRIAMWSELIDQEQEIITLRDALRTLLDAVERKVITEGDCNQARASLKLGDNE